MAKDKRQQARNPRERSREHCEELLDEALKQTFPASDPPAVTAPPCGPGE